jgi:hypothetical protein
MGREQTTAVYCILSPNGQTIEHINNLIEQFLRVFVNYKQDGCVQRLPMVEFAANNSSSETTGCSLLLLQ